MKIFKGLNMFIPSSLCPVISSETEADKVTGVINKMLLFPFSNAKQLKIFYKIVYHN